MKKEKATWEAKMKDEVTNEEAHVTNLENPTGQLSHALEEQHFRTLPRDIKDEDMRECNFVPSRVEEEIQDPTLVEDKKTELANEEELLMEKRQVEEQLSRTTIENVLVGIDKFNFLHWLSDFGHGRGPTSLIYRKTFQCHKSSMN